MGVLVSFVSLMVCVPWYTVLERKILGYSQLRKGPNKSGFMGVLQPIADAIKLLFKIPTLFLVGSEHLFYLLCPFLSFLCVYFCWTLFPSFYCLTFFPITLGIFLCWVGLNTYGVLLGGWSSNSKWSILASVRGIAQNISYEVCLLTCIFIPIFFFSSLEFFTQWSLFFLPASSFVIFFILFTCETNRSPFDFVEGESELVSGFNLEYGAFPFALYFLGEYGSMLFSSVLLILWFFYFYCWVGALMYTICCLFFLIFRCSFPRFRFDLLMGLCWSYLLLVCIGFFSFLFFI